MKNEKDILKWFKNNSDHANEAPGPNVWNRLENELQSQPVVSVKLQWWKLASGIAALFLISVLIFSPFSHRQGVQFAKNDSSVEAASAEMDKAIVSKAAYDDSVNNLKVTVGEIVKLSEKNKVQNEESIMTANSNDQSSGYSKESAGNLDQIAINPPPALEPVEIASITNDKPEIVVVDNEPSIFAMTDSNESEDEEQIEISDIELNDEMGGVGLNKTSVMDIETANAREEEVQMEEDNLTNDKRNNKIEGVSIQSMKKDRMSGTPANQRGSVDLDWMVGEWQEEKANQTIVENWMKINENELIGEGYAISQTDTVFYEQLKISSFNGQVILQMQIDQASPPVNFQLVRNDGSIAVFNNYEIEFPNEIVYERLGNNILNATLRSAQSNGFINDSNYVGNRNINYLQQRNNMSNSEMYRNMRRNTN